VTSPNLAGLDGVTPADVARYLAATGWSERQRARHMSVWTTAENGFELLLPFDAEFRDYNARLRDAVHTIALAEERAARDVLADMAATTVDTQHFRLRPDLPSGTIALVDIVDVVRGVRDLMYAAAHATTVDGPMLIQPRPRPPQVNAFVRGVRVVAPAAGSFVLSAQVPIRGDPGSLPFNRRVVLRMHQAIGATHAAAVEAVRRDSVEPFVEHAEDGVSANLCEAVALIGRTQQFDLRFAWARSMPLNRDAPQFSFDQPLIGAVRVAARELPRLAAESEVVITARVIRLDRIDQGHGRATLRGRMEHRPGYVADVSIAAVLPPELYDRAVVAHREQRQIKVVGQLRGTELSRVTSLEIVDGSS
jgi:hypothetical protein